MKYLLLSTHTDDVELGCGGTLKKLLSQSHNLFWVLFSTAEDSVHPNMPKNTLRNDF